MIARKRFGQHFLEPVWIAKVIDAIQPGPDDSFLEIGPGKGALTLPLAARAARVTAFEIDRDLAASLRRTAPPNVEIVEGDFLTQPIANPPANPLRIAGNLPYNVASPILFRLIQLFNAGFPFRDATLMLQREVADRLIARPGTKDYGVLGILAGLSADIERLLTLPPGAFRPSPKVRSALVRLSFRVPFSTPLDQAGLAALVHAVFTRRRKTLENALLAYTPASKASIATVLNRTQLDGRRRPETLELREFVALSDAFAALSAVD